MKERTKRWPVGLVCLLMAFLPGVYAVPGLVRSTGLVGTPGTFTVLLCETSGTGRGSHTVCHGTFRPDGGGRPDDRASIDTEYDRGERVAVTRSGGAYYSVTPEAFFGWLAVDCVVVFLLFMGGRLLRRAAHMRGAPSGGVGAHPGRRPVH
ncbi:hypothetical protein [Streptomyces roseoverticillatus]|uniref:Uncharacterized protein n=1 Tax=Streptomyces roseoverticillatus TaxID=66429 RepID=A0ABV3J3T4_9ACTN